MSTSRTKVLGLCFTKIILILMVSKLLRPHTLTEVMRENAM